MNVMLPQHTEMAASSPPFIFGLTNLFQPAKAGKNEEFLEDVAGKGVDEPEVGAEGGAEGQQD
jgi:hypothetical protein